MKRGLLGLLLAVPVIAAAHPDQAVRVEAYEPQKRTSLVLQKGRVTNVTFSVMERIKRIVSVEPGPVSTIGKDDKNQEALINNLPLFGQSQSCRHHGLSGRHGARLSVHDQGGS